jgi:MarR family transcriptional regulator, 2-MHQ and catechol-resistance regulon repressor
MNHNLEILLDGQQFKRIYERKFNQVSEKYGLTKLEIEIILFLENNTENDTAKDIVELLLFSKSHVSKAIASLVSSGYVVAKPDESDRRCIHLILSDSACQVVAEAKEMRENLVDILFEGVTPAEKGIMDAVAGKIVRNIKEVLGKDQKLEEAKNA